MVLLPNQQAANGVAVEDGGERDLAGMSAEEQRAAVMADAPELAGAAGRPAGLPRRGARPRRAAAQGGASLRTADQTCICSACWVSSTLEATMASLSARLCTAYGVQNLGRQRRIRY